MANEYLVNSADMTAVADAIRNKGGTSGALTFPGGFVDAVGAIQADGGGEDNFSLHLNNMLTNAYSASVTRLKEYSFYKKTNLVTASFPNAEYVEANCFNKCTALSSLEIPNSIGLDNLALSECASLTHLTMPKGRLFYMSCMGGTGLKHIDLGSSDMLENSGEFGSTVFNYATHIESLILRHPFVMTLRNINAFNNCNLAGFNGVYSGHIYVPSALIESYNAATNWATLYAAYPDIFRTIEGSEYE